ncbi:MAG: hypothetical protein QNJ51_20495 [Calothrix sp. MO_167.B12]|nr:hypothetical protein [Calothrix sp. MO_167.B12]
MNNKALLVLGFILQPNLHLMHHFNLAMPLRIFQKSNSNPIPSVVSRVGIAHLTTNYNKLQQIKLKPWIIQR